MSKLTLIFAGLITIAMDDDVPVYNNVNVHLEETSPIDVYLLNDTGHVPELWVPRDYADSPGTPPRASTDPLACDEPPDPPNPPSPDTRKKCVGIVRNQYEYGDCTNPIHDHYVWCLRDTLVVLPQKSGGATSYMVGHRNSDHANGRHMAHQKPNDINPQHSGRRQDITWIPEMKKIVDAGDLKEDISGLVTTRLDGLRGVMSAADVTSPGPYSPLNGPLWKWCDGVACTDPPPTVRKYDQVFDDGAKLELSVEHLTVFLLPLKNNTIPPRWIRLKQGPPPDVDPTVRVVNRSKSPALTPVRDRCVAGHFEHYYELLDSQSVVHRLPFTEELDCTRKGMTVSDSFCPPVITIKNP